MQIKNIYIKTLYGGGYELRATMEDGQTVVIEDGARALAMLSDSMNARGFTLERKPRQEYQRLTINK